MGTLFTSQGIHNASFILRHICQQTQLGTLILITLDWLQHVAGTRYLLLQNTTRPIPHLSNPWLEQLRTFLNSINGLMHIPDLQQPALYRTHDQYLMDAAMRYWDDKKTLEKIN